MIVIFGIIVQKIDFELYTILYTPIRVIEDIYVLQSGKLCSYVLNISIFKGQAPLFQGVGYILQEAIYKSRVFGTLYKLSKRPQNKVY